MTHTIPLPPVVCTTCRGYRSLTESGEPEPEPVMHFAECSACAGTGLSKLYQERLAFATYLEKNPLDPIIKEIEDCRKCINVSCDLIKAKLSLLEIHWDVNTIRVDLLSEITAEMITLQKLVNT